MSNSEQHEYLCGILAKLVDSALTSDELRDLASALGIKVEEFYGAPEQTQALEVIELKEQRNGNNH